MKLPSFLTTPTLFSKSLAILLFVALPFFGFYFGSVYQQSVTVSPGRVIEFCPEIKLQPKPSSVPNTIKTSLDANGASYHQIGQIKKVYSRGAYTHMDIDYVQWLGDIPHSSDPLAGSRACLEAGDCKPENCDLTKGSCLTNGYYILNQNPKVRSLKLTSTVNILILDEAGVPRPTSIEGFSAQTISSPDLLYWIKLSDTGEITSILQQYQP